MNVPTFSQNVGTLFVPAQCSHVPTPCSQKSQKCSHCGGVRTPCSRCSHCSHEKIELYKREKRKKKRYSKIEKKNALKAIYKKSENIGNTLCFLSIKPFITPFSLLFRVPIHWEHTGNTLGTSAGTLAVITRCSHVPTVEFPFRLSSAVSFSLKRRVGTPAY